MLRAVLAFLAIACAGWPLWKLTRTSEATSAQTAEVVAVRDVPLRLTFSTPPKRFAVLHLGETLWMREAPAAEVERVVKMAYPQEGVDLQLKVDWPSTDTASAVRVQLTDPAGDEHAHTVWGRGEMLETVTFP